MFKQSVIADFGTVRYLLSPMPGCNAIPLFTQMTLAQSEHRAGRSTSPGNSSAQREAA